MNSAIQQNLPNIENESYIHSNSIQTPPEMASKYTFIRQLGQGTQGTVYLARRNDDNIEVAIKRLDIESVRNWKEYDLFQREGNVLKTLNIKGVAKFYEAPEFLEIEHPAAYIVQEYINGKSLEQMIKSGFRFPLHRLFRWVLNVLDILEALHTHEPPIVHRDLKPSNILMKPLPNGEFEPYLIDFGAVANPQVQAGGSTVAGTYGYMPSEQLMGKPVPASDIYALACVIVFMMSGKEPVDMQVSDFHLIIESYLENIPNIVTATLHQMLEPTIDKRLADYSSLKERFEWFVEDKYELSFSSDIKLEENKLLSVHKIGQHGNIDLWMALPTQTPRTLPDFYYNPIPGRNCDDESIYPRLKKYYSKGRIKALLQYKKLIISILGAIVFLMIVGLIIVPIIMNYPMTFSEILFSGMLLLLPLIIYFSDPDLYKSKKPNRQNMAHKNLFKLKGYKKSIHNDPIHNEIYHKLLDYGSKSIAIVVDITYVPVTRSDVETYHAPNGDQLGYLHTCPTFRLRYRFNPPDDDNPNDLIHEIYIHHYLVDSLHPGDPIPILYYIHPNNKADVMSMPFPYPLGDISDMKEVYFRNPGFINNALA